MFFKKPLKVEKNENNRVPPGQTVTDKFPVLTDGPAPEVKKDEWVFEIKYENEILRSFNCCAASYPRVPDLLIIPTLPSL